MYYVFMETGDDDFFLKIIRAFCSKVVKSIFELDAHKTLNQSNNSEMLGNKIMTDFLDKDGSVLYFLNCYLFPSVTSGCVNDECKKEHTVVLTNEQVAGISNSIHEAVKIEKVLKNYKERPDRERVNIDNVFQNYEAKIISKIVSFSLGVKKNRRKNEYLDAYIRKSEALLNDNDAEGFAYISSGTKESDFDYFRDNAKLPDLISCDKYQRI